LVSPVNLRETLEELIDTEIGHAQQGQRAEIMVKVNNLVDPGIIKRLVAAAQAGVRVRAIVRGMCGLKVPADLSKRLEIISIVDRFLEHPRVYWFYHGGKEQVFISSADLMTRNLDRRVEVACPIYNSQLQLQIKHILELQWQDNTKARIIDAEQKNQYRKRGNRKKIRSQLAVYDYLKAEMKRMLEAPHD